MPGNARYSVIINYRRVSYENLIIQACTKFCKLLYQLIHLKRTALMT